MAKKKTSYIRAGYVWVGLHAKASRIKIYEDMIHQKAQPIKATANEKIDKREQ